jgi:sulfoxide reductase heme-binding subunit YedZ
MIKKISLFLILLSPLVYLIYNVQEANDPIKYIYIKTGYTALVLLMITLTISAIKKIINFLKYRKIIGLFTFFYAFLHFSNFFILDAEMNVAFVIKETLDKPFVYLGTISLLILAFMTITSTKKLFRKFKAWHRVIYIVLVLVSIHSVMAQKVLGNLEYAIILFTCTLLVYKIFGLKGLKSKKQMPLES